MPGGSEALDAALAAGATCSFLSGSGSTLAALAAPARGREVATAMAAAIERAGAECQVFVLPADGRGAEAAIIHGDGSTWTFGWDSTAQ